MLIEFDPDKDAANRQKHGVPLAFGTAIWSDPAHLIVATIRAEDGEQRFRAIGRIDQHLWTAVHVYRDDSVRMISVRRSNDGERRVFDRPEG